MAWTKNAVGRAIVGAPLELSAAQDTVFHHVLRGWPKEVRTRLAVGLFDDDIGPSPRVHSFQVHILYYIVIILICSKTNA